MISKSLEIVRSEAEKGTMTSYSAGFHMGQKVAFQAIGQDMTVSSAAFEASSEIFDLFMEATKASI